MRKLLMLFLLRLAYKHGHKILRHVENRGARGRPVVRRKPAVKRRRAGWEF